MITPSQAILKRTFDVVLAIVGLILTGWLILIAWVLATIDTGANGMFAQVRIGRGGRPFRVFKIRSMRPAKGSHGQVQPEDELDWTTVTTANDQRITRLGRIWRRTKIDELPQLVNVLLGQMSFVGPRPDVPGFADRLQGDDRLILTMRPGITGPATLKYRHEEEILAAVENPESYNREVIFPDKVRLNSEYVKSWTFAKDIEYIFMTVLRIGTISQSQPTGDQHKDTATSRTGLAWSGYFFVKRTLDLVVSGLGLILLSPLLLLISVLVLIRLGAPVLFRQTRAGWNGEPFELIKFRTMSSELGANGELLPDGERLTGFGKFLRSTSLDELPELWNILKGEMSLVGPRPLLMEYLPRYDAQQARRHEVKPGLTGWAQIQGRNSIDWNEKFNHDVWYVDHQSTWLDLKILAMTLWRVLTRQGISAAGQATAEPFLGQESTPATLSTPSPSSALSGPTTPLAPDLALGVPGSAAGSASTASSAAPNGNGFSLNSALEYINQVLANSQRPKLSSIRGDQSLQQDLGLDSLELAELTVRIEADTGIDIFATGVVRTVGEVLKKLEPAGAMRGRPS